MAIKKSKFVPDAPFVPTTFPEQHSPVPNQGPQIPIYMGGEIPVGPGGGRADAPGGAPVLGGPPDPDFLNLGNNPFIVSPRARELLRQEIEVAAEEAARVATEQAVIVRIPPC